MSSNTLDRTSDQELANELDCDLYRLICRAEARFRASKDRSWLKAADALRDARKPLRAKMHIDDRAATI